MKLLKSILIAALALGMTTGASQASVVLLDSLEHDYGSAAGKVDPGGSDALGLDYVEVKDNSTSRFYDDFNLSGINGTISELRLTLTFADAGPSLAEWWLVRVLGSISDGSDAAKLDDAYFTLWDYLSPQTIVLTSLIDSGTVDVWEHTIQTLVFSYAFSEETGNLIGADRFKLDSAVLAVYGTAAVVPLPAAAPLLLGGLGLLGFLGRRRKS